MPRLPPLRPLIYPLRRQYTPTHFQQPLHRYFHITSTRQSRNRSGWGTLFPFTTGLCIGIWAAGGGLTFAIPFLSLEVKPANTSNAARHRNHERDAHSQHPEPHKR